MKKAILTFGLFAMVMILTSFTAPETGGQSIKFIKDFYDQGGNGQQVPKQDKGLGFDQGGNGQQVPKQGKGLEFEQGGNGQQIPKQGKSL